MSYHAVPSPQMLDVLCPMHVVVSETGHIRHVGPTLRKLRPHGHWDGERFLEVFRLSRPRETQSVTDVLSLLGRKLHLELREQPGISLKGVAVREPVMGGLVLNLSFGISILEAVREFDLTGGDFAPTDMTVEMLYLVEAKSTAMEASRNLNLRLQGAKAAAEEQAFTDALTGLKNRRAMDMTLARLVSSQEPFSMLHVDLDYFKAVNDTLGHAAGDHVLLQVAKAFNTVMRSQDHVARVGGDEFVILTPGLIDVSRLTEIGERIISELERPLEFNGNPCRISGSIGTVIWARHRMRHRTPFWMTLILRCTHPSALDAVVRHSTHRISAP